MTGFTSATAVTAVGAGRYEAGIDEGWTIVGKPNGGYLLALMARAALCELATAVDGQPHVLAASAHYLRAPSPGPAIVAVDPLRTGRSMSQIRARLEQDGQACVEALLTVGALEPAAEPSWQDREPVPLPPAQRCLRVPAEQPGQGRIALYDEIEALLDPANLGFTTGAPGGTGELRGWLRFADGHEPGPLTLLFAVDSFPPATLDLGSRGWVPTLELSAYVRALPAPGPLRVRQRARLVEGGLVDEVCEVWDSRGRLVAQGTQLARVRPFAPSRPG